MLRKNKGFTLIEATVVFALLLFLAAVSIPAGLDPFKTSSDEEARSSLIALVDNQYNIHSTNGSLTEDPEVLRSLDLSRTYLLNGSSTNAKTVSFEADLDSSTITGATLGQDNTCWLLLYKLEGKDGPERFWGFKSASTNCIASDARALEARGDASKPVDLT